MKPIKTTLTVLLFIAVMLPWTSCKKESSTPAPRSAQEMIAGKWRLQSTIQNDFYSGTSHVSTYTGTAADYADFRNDGKIYSLVNNSYDTVAYAMISDTKMWVDNPSDIFDIQVLTDANLKIYRKEVISAGEYHETTNSLMR